MCIQSVRVCVSHVLVPFLREMVPFPCCPHARSRSFSKWRIFDAESDRIDSFGFGLCIFLHRFSGFLLPPRSSTTRYGGEFWDSIPDSKVNDFCAQPISWPVRCCCAIARNVVHCFGSQPRFLFRLRQSMRSRRAAVLLASEFPSLFLFAPRMEMNTTRVNDSYCTCKYLCSFYDGCCWTFRLGVPPVSARLTCWLTYLWLIVLHILGEAVLYTGCNRYLSPYQTVYCNGLLPLERLCILQDLCLFIVYVILPVMLFKKNNNIKK